jgi:hypothetical protein
MFGNVRLIVVFVAFFSAVAKAQDATQHSTPDSQSQRRESTSAKKDPKRVADLLVSVSFDMRAKAYNRALATAQRVQGMHAAAYGAESLPAADDNLLIGQIYLAQRKPHEALRAFAAADGVRTMLAGWLDPGRLPILDRLNDAFTAITGHGDETTYRQALSIREVLYGENSSELICTVEGLANLYFTERMAGAEDLYLRLLALWAGAVGKDHPMVAVTLDKLVVFYIRYGEPEKAREALARSVAIRARFLARGLSLQAEDAVSENHPERATALYNRALAALGPPLTENEESIAEIKRALAEIGSSR